MKKNFIIFLVAAAGAFIGNKLSQPTQKVEAQSSFTGCLFGINAGATATNTFACIPVSQIQSAPAQVTLAQIQALLNLTTLPTPASGVTYGTCFNVTAPNCVPLTAVTASNFVAAAPPQPDDIYSPSQINGNPLYGPAFATGVESFLAKLAPQPALDFYGNPVSSKPLHFSFANGIVQGIQ